MHAKEIVMRLFRFLMVMFVSFVMLVVASLSSAQTVTTVFSFDGTNGQYPFFGMLTQGRDGKLYGTTYQGGACGNGTVFKQSTTSNGNIVVHSFCNVDGLNPNGGLTLARDGNFYGTTLASNGELFRISSDGTLAVLRAFTGDTDGDSPLVQPIEASDGNLYGTTNGLNSLPSTVYRYTATGDFSTIYTFPSMSWTPMLQAENGNLYLTTYEGGTLGGGTISRIALTGALKHTYNFGGRSQGANPLGVLIQASDGNIYGTTQNGGRYRHGSVFKVDSKGAVTVVYSFGATSTDGQAPEAGLIQATDGNLYGSTVIGGSGGQGTLFRLTLAGDYTQLYTFPATDTSYQQPIGLIQHTSGLIYGLTELGGQNQMGSVFTLDMSLGPFITFVRGYGKVGATVEILGQNLTGTSSVTFDGVPATSFSVVSDTYITAIVPAGATTGPVVVTTPSGTMTSNKNFRMSL